MKPDVGAKGAPGEICGTESAGSSLLKPTYVTRGTKRQHRLQQVSRTVHMYGYLYIRTRELEHEQECQPKQEYSTSMSKSTRIGKRRSMGKSVRTSKRIREGATERRENREG
jgi:hypothetical protein